MKKFCNELKNKKYYFVVLILFWVYILIIKNPLGGPDTNDLSVIYGDTSCVTEAVVPGVEVKQTFTATVDNMCYIGLYPATFGRKNTGNITVTVTDETNNKTITEKDIDCSELVEAVATKITFEQQGASKGNIYSVSVTSSDSTYLNCIALYASTTSMEGVEKISVNNEPKAMSTVFELGYTTDSLKTIKAVFWIFTIILSFVFTYFVNGADEKNFLKVSFILGIWVIIFNPFVHMMDESTHFFRSYAISKGDFIDDMSVDKKIGAYISDNYEHAMINQLSLQSYLTNSDYWNMDFSSETTFITNPYMSSVIPINHAFGAIGIFIGNMLHLNMVWVILLGRLVDYIFYVIICFLAIKNMKYYKSLIFIVATLPMPMLLAASYSLDPILIATSLLFISICLKYFFEKNEDTSITKLDMGLLLFCAICIASVKYLVYTPILLLYFLIPRSKFRNKKGYFILLGTALCIVVCMAVTQVYLLKKLPFTEDRNGDVDVARQLKYVMSHKINAIRIWMSYFVESIHTHFTSFHYQVGIDALGSATGLFTIFAAIVAKDKYGYTEKNRKRVLVALSIFISVAIFTFTIISLYLGYSPVGGQTVDGLQTRYIVPFVFLVMLPVACIDVKSNIRNWGRKVGFIMGLSMCNMLAGLLLLTFN